MSREFYEEVEKIIKKNVSPVKKMKKKRVGLFMVLVLFKIRFYFGLPG